LASVKKELQHAKKDNVALAHYINARRKEETHKKVEEGQSSKDVRTWRK
jgi:predicted CopG family antitoxin